MMGGKEYTDNQENIFHKYVLKKKWHTAEAAFTCGRVSRTTLVHINEVLNEHAGPFLANMGENAMFMHNNAQAHTA
ncbi:hypothetical protein JYU34_002797 [Plutella xylostella]|uniref:Transposase n=1 Tax=Plutella xylostella TaxID=51655 RepID=A0ABQ7R356_PLUXY|nr:hypothetical protein JYU34_002797 [Plutella xylostella]